VFGDVAGTARIEAAPTRARCELMMQGRDDPGSPDPWRPRSCRVPQHRADTPHTSIRRSAAACRDWPPIPRPHPLVTDILGFVALEIPVELAAELARISTDDQFQFGIRTFLAGLSAQAT
jgi:hypothetical protein